MLDQQVVAFAVVAALLVLTPGLDMALVTKNALRHGQRAAFMTALGINFGVFLWTVAAAIGIAALVRASETGFTALKLAGAAYLVYLGLTTIRRAGHDDGSGRPDAGGERLLATSVAFRQGALSNLLNPRSPSSTRACCRSSSLRATRSC